MKISHNWLKQYLDFDLSPEELSRLLTGCGLEVESLEPWQSVKGGLKGVVIGEVLTCKKHPDADKLSVTTVDIGGQVLPIVCGAPNVTAGQKVAVATVGTILYKGEESFEIQKARIRGEVSEGMICAEDELGLGSSHAGIMVLNPDAIPGTAAANYFKAESDFVFEIGLTPNRTDATSHIGVARDIKAVLDNIAFLAGSEKNRKMNIPSVESFRTENTNLDIEVNVEDTIACPRYTGVTVAGITVGESPAWLKNRLNAIGLRPINNIVDITNFVLHETGQPLHAFDADEIKGFKVVVKKLPKGSKFVTLDEIERELTGNDLMICNTEEGMCIGGVFGGVKSGVTEKTKDIFIESAYFDPVHIRKTSKYHDLQTDASFRFERGVDPDIILYALKRAALLVKEIAGGTISSEIKDVYTQPIPKVKVDVSWANIDRLIGKSIGHDVIMNILNSLHFKTLQENSNGLQLEVPSCRVDVTREADVIEEILRIYGYNNIEIPAGMNSSVSHGSKPDPETVQYYIMDYLSNNGFREIMNNSLTRSAYYENQTDFNSANCVGILNPLSRDLNVMRQSLLHSGLETIIYNINRKISDQKLFEFGKIYKIRDNTAPDVIKKYEEPRRLAIFVTGRRDPESWNTESKEVDFSYLKAVSLNILRRLGVNPDDLEHKDSAQDYFAEGISYFKNSEQILDIGMLSTQTLHSFDIRQCVYYAEFYWDQIFALAQAGKIQYRPVPKFPEVRRDLALLVSTSITFAEIEKLAFKTEKMLLKSINLFDVYEGGNIETGKKSYAVSFILQDEEKTLTDKVIDRTMARLMAAYQSELDAVIR
ncbi:MAG: phenylalanine--tRNA ligase subunit beta [Bacteroidetes bacterium]|nr:phenylalanine--tRNA ligase subunit beta [Bacteroidota bacterium]